MAKKAKQTQDTQNRAEIIEENNEQTLPNTQPTPPIEQVEQEEPLPPEPEATPPNPPIEENAPTQPTPPKEDTQEPPTEQEQIDSLKTRLEQALNQNDAWKEQVYLTLQGLCVLLERFNGIKLSFEHSYKLIKEDKESLERKREELNAKYSQMLELIKEHSSSFELLKSTLDNATQQVLTNVQTCIDQALLCENTLSETKGVCVDILGYREDILLTLEKLKALESQKNEFLALFAQGNMFLEEIKTTKESILSAISQKGEEITLSLSTHANSLTTQLQKAKEILQADLQEQENQALLKIQKQMRNVDSKITELEENFINKKAQLELANSEIQNARQSLEQAKADFSANTIECEKKLQTATDTHILNLNAKKDELAIALNEESKIHSENLAELKSAYKQELDSVCAGEIAIIKKYIEQIQARTTQFGANFIKKSFLENGTFIPPSSGIYYYVFLQGGSGVDSSAENGAPSSFGSHLSALGGKGGELGKGMRGECVSGFVELESTEPIEVSVGSGGICIVSYTQKEAVGEVL